MVVPLQWWEFLSYKTMLFLRLFQRVILAKLFKASMACKEYSAVFLSLWINQNKTAVRVKCLTQLNVCPMLNLKGRAVRGSSSSSKVFWLQFQQRFQWKMCSAHGLQMFQRSGWPHQSTSSPAFVQALPGLSGLEISESPQHITQVVV